MDLAPPPFPGALFEWAGHRSGGVSRLFHDGSGKPSGSLIDTPLLLRLKNWAAAIGEGQPQAPRIVLLVGGPGNGKTEAVEATIRELENALGIDGKLVAVLRPEFNPVDGTTVPRLVRVQLAQIPGCERDLSVTIVQDASVSDSSGDGRTPAELLARDLEECIAAGPEFVYLACVNRGVLDDAMIGAIEAGRKDVRALIESIVRAAGTSPAAPSCWPLSGYPSVAIWPMDIESLLVERPQGGMSSPASQVLAIATDEDRWPQTDSCAAGKRCPFCRNRLLLSESQNQATLIRILRWHELATGKRWNFRDLFSLVSFLLAGAPPEGAARSFSPCEGAARLIELTQRQATRPESAMLAAPFQLLALQYQHVLFGEWPRPRRSLIRTHLKSLKLDGHRTLLGLHHFLAHPRADSGPSTIRLQLAALCDALDPALADPDFDAPVSSRANLKLRELDARFSHSVREGFQFVHKHHFLSPIEVDVLTRLAEADEDLGVPEVRRRKPTSAVHLQSVVRDFSCRLVRRSIGARLGIVRDLETFAAFEKVVQGEDQLMHQAVKQVEGLLNDRGKFVVALNTTFGEPLPPITRRVMLTTEKQRVRPRQASKAGRPESDIRFMEVGSGQSAECIPVTFDLYRSVRELQNGMFSASLPRTVVALLDTTRARLAGRIVRDEEQLEGSEIRVGLRKDVIVRELRKFVLRRENEQ